MSEQAQFNSFDLLVGKYNPNPYLWGVSFVEQKQRKANSAEDPLYNAEFRFTRSVLEETHMLIGDIQSANATPSSEVFTKLRDTGRISPQDCTQILALNDYQMAAFLKFYYQNASIKIKALAEYLAQGCYTEAIPISFLAETAKDTLFSQGFQTVDGNSFEAIDRNRIIRISRKMYARGGKVAFPSWNTIVKQPAVLRLGEHGQRTSLEFEERNMNSINNIKYENESNRVILGMLTGPREKIV